MDSFGEDKVNLVKIDVYFLLIIYSRIRLQYPNYESMKSDAQKVP